MKRRVVVTGIGWVTPLGRGVEHVWSSLLAGKSGIGTITRFDAAAFPVRIAGEVKDFNAEDWLERTEARRTDRFVQYAVAAAAMAAEDAKLSVPVADPYRAGAIVGSGAGGMETIEHGQNLLIEKGPHRVPPMSIPRMMINAAAHHVARRFGFRGPTLGVVQACATGAAAAAQAAEQIAYGRCDLALAGGTEASVTPLSVAAFSACGALSRRNEDPQSVCRPFDTGRDGFVMSEGCCVLVLESEEHARARGARIYAELAGWGLTADVFHVTAPDPEATAAAKAIEFALESAGETPEAVGYINAHGTSTAMNDPTETKAIHRALGAHAQKPFVSSTKSMLGHMMGAAGAVEAAIAALAVHTGRVPPTINLQNPDPECALNHVANASVEAPDLRLALSNSFAFGGHNVVLALRRYAA